MQGMGTMTARKPRKDKFSRLDIIGEHELKVRECSDDRLYGRCGCGMFEQYVNNRNLTCYERMNDAFLKHVQAVRDAMRGHTEG